MVLAAGAQADVLGFRLGAYQWQQDYDGDVQSGGEKIDLQNDLGFDDDDGTVLYLALEHPLPLVPNLLLQRTEISSKNTASLQRSFTFDGVTYNPSETVTTDLDLSHTDATFYYEFLDNVVSLDAGLTVRVFDEGVKLRGSSSGSSKVDIDGVLPMLYLAGRFDLPLSGLYIGAEANGIAYSDTSLIDTRVNIGYETAIGLGLELGYRAFDLDYDDDDDKANVTVDGAYGSLFYHF
jgi:outer membrane protein